MTSGQPRAARRSNGRRPELGKYLLWLHFSKDAAIRKYLPQTGRYSAQKLETYLRRYRTVYVKPDGGSRGLGILKVWKDGGAIFVHHTTRRPHRFTSLVSAQKYIESLRGGRFCVIQEGISLARVNGRPFDIRVMMQKEVPGGKWQYSGMAAKVAGPGSVVTNVALSHGRVITVEHALKESLGWSQARIKRCTDELIRLGHRAAVHFDKYQSYREIGFDVAVDTKGRVWLIEENTAPSHPLFAKLKSDQAPYRRIQYRWGRYQRALKRKATRVGLDTGSAAAARSQGKTA